MPVITEVEERIIGLVLDIIHNQNHDLIHQLTEIKREIKRMGIELDNLSAEVARNTLNTAAIVVRIEELKIALANASDPATLQALSDQLAQNNAALETAVA